MAEQANDPLIGQAFHGYRIERKLAEGGMGAVYQVRHTELPDLLKVLKVIRPEVPADQCATTESRKAATFLRDWMASRFELEAAAISRLNHPNIVPIDGIGAVDGHRCILMPFLVGKPLDQLIHERGGRLAPHDALHIAAQIARAMDYVHRRGIIHRDLKPSNVFVVPTEDDPLEIKVIDFGVAKLMNSDVSKTGATQMGTPLYMSIEQFQDSSSVTALADVYSLALVVWKMVTGVLPWGEEDTEGLYRRRLLERIDPPPPGTMPDGWEKPLRSAWAVELCERPQSMRELVYPLALDLPANPPRYKSGIEILRGVARRWVEISPDDETVRNVEPRANGRSPSSPSAEGPPVAGGRRGTWRVPPSQMPGCRKPGQETQDQTPSTLRLRKPRLAALSAADGMPLGASARGLLPRVVGTRKLALLGLATALLASLGVLLVIGALRKVSIGDSMHSVARPVPAGPEAASSPAAAPSSAASSPTTGTLNSAAVVPSSGTSSPTPGGLSSSSVLAPNSRVGTRSPAAGVTSSRESSAAASMLRSRSEAGPSSGASSLAAAASSPAARPDAVGE
jgi:serine/threonine-protein kinase